MLKTSLKLFIPNTVSDKTLRLKLFVLLYKTTLCGMDSV